MKTLYLVRHAKSSWDFPELTDFERPLNKRGKRDAPFMGKLLNDKNVKPELIIASPALRAYNTARIIAGRLDYPLENIETSEVIYDASVRDLTDLIQNFDNKFNSVMLFGHNPGLTSLSNLLTDKHVGNIPTCAVVGIEFDIQSWKEVKPDTGKFLFIDKPKDHFKK